MIDKEKNLLTNAEAFVFCCCCCNAIAFETLAAVRAAGELATALEVIPCGAVVCPERECPCWVEAPAAAAWMPWPDDDDKGNEDTNSNWLLLAGGLWADDVESADPTPVSLGLAVVVATAAAAVGGEVTTATEWGWEPPTNETEWESVDLLWSAEIPLLNLPVALGIAQVGLKRIKK